MNIGIVCYPTFGGSGVVATELGKAMAEKGHNVHFIAYRQPARLDHISERITFHEVVVPKYPLFEYPPYESALAGEIAQVARTEMLDLLHVHYAVPHASAGYMAKQLLEEDGIYLPLITTLHGTDINLVGKNESFSPIVAHSINHSDGITAVSDSLRSDTIERFGTEKPIEVIPNFLNLDRFKRIENEKLKDAIAPHGERIVVHTSNFRKVKRVQDVVEVFRGVLDELPAKLVLIGDGQEKPKIEALCREMGISDHVRFTGKQEPVEEMLSVADLFLLTSEMESFGLAALEAMACEVPLISTNIGGIPEINIEGVTGFLHDVGDTVNMTKSAIRILEDDKLLALFRKHARDQALEFDKHKVIPAYEDYYYSIMETFNNQVESR
jgi:N-acetyl-alpha-D-glucosaminyl L-malate synthase BshA